jgi:NAD+ synthase (glutamine-hydrolysing)
MRRWGVDKPAEFIKDLEWFDRQMQGSVFKRVQSSPGIIVSKSSFGYDERESILPYWTSERAEGLKAQILAGKDYVPAGDAK